MNISLQADDREGFEPFLGSWGLVSFEHVLPSGGVLRPFRDSPLGLIDELEGQMALHRQRAGEG